MSSAAVSAILLAMSMFSAISCQELILGVCRTPKVVENFSLSNFAGYWYEIQRYQGLLNFVSNVRCSGVNYTVVNENSVMVNSTATSLLLEYTVKTSYVAKINDNNEPAKWTIFLQPALDESYYGNVTDLYQRYWILDTDYTSYALVYACNGNNFFSTQWASILSREDTLSPKVLESIRKRVSEYSLLDWYFRPVSHNNCKY